MVGLGGLALYGLCRQLGVGRGGSALGAATYLFNPLGFVLAFTFMTDPHFTALQLGATFFYARGLYPGTSGARATLTGSGIAALAFLTRQQGALIPLAVVGFLLVTRRLRFDRASLRSLLRVGAIPAAAMVGYYLWLRFVNNVPAVQGTFLREARDAGWPGTWRLVRHLTFFELVYLGFFAFPVVAAALPAMRRLVRAVPPGGWVLVCAWEAVVVAGVTFFGVAGRWMPYVPQFLGPGGPGAADVRNARPDWLDLEFRT